jgi:predicted PurR-regulated permease PerM
MNDRKITVDVSVASLVKIVIFILVLWILYLVRDIIVLLFVVGIITIALEPFVEKLEKDGVPRSFSVIVLYLALLTIVGLAVYFIVPPVASQIGELTINLPYYASKINEINLSYLFPLSDVLENISSQLSGAATSVVTTLVSIFGGVVSAIVVFALTYYSLVEKEGLRRLITLIIPVAHKNKLYNTIQKVSEKLGNWLRGQLVLMLTVGVLDGVIFASLGIRYALTLALLAGLLEIVPVVGPIVAALVVVFVAFSSGVAIWKILLLVILFVAVQQLENHVLVPKIMQKAVGLSPVVVIIAILIGSKLLGIGGAILAVPVAAGVQVFIAEFFPDFKLTKANK